jgi:signal transduction histidine kinase
MLFLILLLTGITLWIHYQAHVRDLLYARFTAQTSVLFHYVQRDLGAIKAQLRAAQIPSSQFAPSPSLVPTATPLPESQPLPNAISKSRSPRHRKRPNAPQGEAELATHRATVAKQRQQIRYFLPALRQRVKESSLLLNALVTVSLADNCLLAAYPLPQNIKPIHNQARPTINGQFSEHSQTQSTSVYTKTHAQNTLPTSNQTSRSVPPTSRGNRAKMPLLERQAANQAIVYYYSTNTLSGVKLLEPSDGHCTSNFPHWVKHRHPRNWQLNYTYSLASGEQLTIGYSLVPPFPMQGKIRTTASVLFIFICVVLLTLPLSRTITKSLQTLTQSVQEIQNGHLSHKVPITGHDEVGELSAAIENMRSTLQRISEQRQMLLSDASHEIRTPLTRIRTVAESVADGLMREPERLTQAMEGICNQIDEIDQLIEDIMEIARFELPNAQPLEFTAIKIDSLLQEMCRVLQPAAEAHSVYLTLEQLPAYLPSIYADKRRLRQVLNNLLQNAIRYSPKGGKISLSVCVERDIIKLEICDQGVGIPFAEREKIFERLYRIDPSRSRSTGGQGLGLAIVKQIVEAHHGQVGVTDAIPQGSCFWVRLPINSKS